MSSVTTHSAPSPYTIPSLSPSQGAVVYVDGNGQANLFAYARSTTLYLTLHYRDCVPTWTMKRFDEIVDSVPIHHYPLRVSLPLLPRLDQTCNAWKTILWCALFESVCTNAPSAKT